MLDANRLIVWRSRCALATIILVAMSGCSQSSSPVTSATATAAETEAPAKEASSKKRDESKKSDKKHTNRLADETSPYLLLHAHNPVDWYPWGDEAFEKAKKEGKVIFLSVGYSSCHWCHVMERESFMDEEIAQYLNEHYVCIKVDREERPDVDSIYMTSVQVYNQVTGSGRGGGWPMSVFMTPEAKPFFGGTYLPARDGDRGAQMGFFTLLKRVDDFWTTKRKNIEEDAETITKMVKRELDGRRPQAVGELDEKVFHDAFHTLEEEYDAEYGGFGFDAANPFRPKFPEPSNIAFLIDRVSSGDLDDEHKATATKLVVGTLERMAMGGIRDHLGGGFHRYSVDRFWKIPHFEKMLYDNGQLTSVYTDAYLLTGREDFKRVVDETLSFVLREMTDENGGFYSALDAESEDEEGKFYRWEKEEVEKLLDAEEFELFAQVYGLDEEPNFEDEYYAPQFSKTFAEIAAALKLGEAELETKLVPIRAKLLEVRNKRERPLTDTKILTSWNGLMIRGFADAGRGLKSEEYVKAAARAADFVLANLRDKEGRLLRTYGEGRAKLNAYLDDYAFLVDGLIALHKATGNEKWLAAADELTAKQLELFWDDRSGGFYFTSGDHESLLARGRDPIDGVEPAGNSVSADNLVYLGKVLDRKEYLDKAKDTIDSVSGIMQQAPHAVPRMAIALGGWLRATMTDDETE